MAKLEEILKSKGWTDADLEAAKPMLSDSRFRTTMEDTYGAMETQLTAAKALNDDWQNKLDTEYNPAIKKYETSAIEAQREAARLREEVRIAKEYGYMTPEAEKDAAKAIEAAERASQPANGYDPKKHPTFEDVGKFAEAEGQYHAILSDLNEEYRMLYGKSLIEYEGQNGRRGMQALREEAKAARSNDLYAFVANKFNFTGKRQEIAAAKQKEHDDAIRKEGAETRERELAEKYGNPMMRMATPSRNSFIPPKPEGGKMPWEIPASQRRSGILQRAMENEMKVRVQ